MASGYTHCADRDCMETAVSNNTLIPELCWECEEAGCEPYRPGDPDYDTLPGHMRECQRKDAYQESEAQ